MVLSPSLAWFEKYRATDINDIIFPNIECKKIVDGWISAGKIDGNVFLYGKGGRGKSNLAQILIKTFIKNNADYKRIISRSVEEIDNLREFLGNSPVSSSMKIILIEEADRLSSKAQVELKEKYTERYLDTSCFIMTTNYPHAIDKNLLQRFTYKFNFDTLDLNEVFKRIKFILDSEESKYNETDLKNWLENNLDKGIRDLINALQVSHKSNNGVIIFEDIGENKDIEDKIIGMCLDIIKTVITSDVKNRKATLQTPNNSIIASVWTELTSTLHNNFGLDYTRIFEDIETHISFLPIKTVVINYMETVNQKKYQHLHLLACLGEMMKVICEVNS